MGSTGFNFLRVAAASPNTKTADIRHNAAEIIATARDAAARGVKVLILPYHAITGVACGGLYRQHALQHAAKAAIRHIVDETNDLDLLLVSDKSPVVLGDFGNVRIGTHIVIESGDKTALAGGWRRVRERAVALSEANGGVYVHVSPGSSETVTEGVFGGGLIICERGRILAERPDFDMGENIIIADVDCDLIAGAWPDEDCDDFRGVRFKNPGITPPLMRPNPQNPFFPINNADYPAFCADIFAIVSTALARRIGHIRARRAVLNLSGGLDSAMALIGLCGAMDMLGRPRSDILTLSLPGFGTSERTAGNARLLAEAVGAEFREIDITEACLRHFKDIGLDPNDRGIAYENAQARERTQIGMDIANMEGGIMIGTGDMSEAALGWATFGGDHLSMYNPNGGLTKTAIREVMGWAAQTSLLGTAAAAVLTDILNTPISPELLPGAQLTEDAIGPYELLDFFLYHMIKNNYTPEKIAFMADQAFASKYPPETIRHWLRGFIKRFFQNQFKRICDAEGPAALDISLSVRSGFSMPGDASATEWLNNEL